MTSFTDNSVFPHRSGYQRPDHADSFGAPHVIHTATTSGGSVVEQAHTAITHAHREFQKHIEATAADRHRYSETGYREQLDKFRDTDAAHAIDVAEATVEALHADAQAAVENLRATLIKPGDAAQESRNVRYWNRTKPVLDNLNAGAALHEAQRLLTKASRTELGVLLEELPSYLRLRVGPLDDQTKLNSDLPKDADWGDWIAAVYLPTAIPEYGALKDKVNEASRALAITRQNAKSLRRAIANGNANTVVITNPNETRYAWGR